MINQNRTTKGVVPESTMSAAVEVLLGAVLIHSGESLRAVKIAMKGLGLFDQRDEDGGMAILGGKMNGVVLGGTER